MAFDPAGDDTLRLQLVHEMGQDLSTLSVDELDERIAWLEREIERLREAKARKEESRAAASAFFKV